jgi:hypothetical protein
MRHRRDTYKAFSSHKPNGVCFSDEYILTKISFYLL